MNFVKPLVTGERRRWLALIVVCMAQLMITLDVTIVNVALPTIQRDLGFTQGNLTWVVNAFLIMFGSLLLLAGRLSDLFGRKPLFLSGLFIFTTASALCGLAPSQGVLIAARALQGVGAALQASVILAIIVTEFPQADERARAMSAYVFTAVAGASLGLLAGGVITDLLSWHWIFFVNIPIGIVTAISARILIPRDAVAERDHHVDYFGSLLVTSSLMLTVYAIVQSTAHGWGSSQVLGFGSLAAVLMAAFIAVEARVAHPIMPLRILRLRGLVGGSVVRALLVSGMYSTLFLGTIYFEHVLHYSAVKTGFAYLPWTLTVAALSLGITARLVKRFGAIPVLVAGLAFATIGLALLTGITPQTSFFPRVFVAFVLMGLGIGSAFVPLMGVAMADVPAADAGLGSGITTLSQQVGGALGLAALGTLATNHTRGLLAQHAGPGAALVGGDHLAFWAGAGAVLAGIVIALAVLRAPRQQVEVAVAVEQSPETAVAEPPAELEPSPQPVIRPDPHRPVRVLARIARTRGDSSHHVIAAPTVRASRMSAEPLD